MAAASSGPSRRSSVAAGTAAGVVYRRRSHFVPDSTAACGQQAPIHAVFTKFHELAGALGEELDGEILPQGIVEHLGAGTSDTSRRSPTGRSGGWWSLPARQARCVATICLESFSPSPPSGQNDAMTSTPDSGTVPAFWRRNVMLGTSLFWPSTMPKSYQPVSTSVTATDLARSMDGVHATPEATTDARTTSAQSRRNMAGRL